jgi:putative transposase
MINSLYRNLMPRPSGPAKGIEDRRRRGLALLDTGLSMNEVGRMLGCAPSSVMRWSQARDRHGDSGITVRFSPGRPLRLKKGDRKRLLSLLRMGALKHGYDTNSWSDSRIADLIKREFDVDYHRSHIRRLLLSLGWGFLPPHSWGPLDST